jgi:hypothetical protein
MVLEPVPSGEEPAPQVPQQVPQGQPVAEAQRRVASGLDGAGDAALAEAPADRAEDPSDALTLPQPALDMGTAAEANVAEPLVRRIEALSVAQAPVPDKRHDGFSPMPQPPVLDLAIEVAARAAPNDVAPAVAPQIAPAIVPEAAHQIAPEAAPDEATAMAGAEASDDVAAPADADGQGVAGDPPLRARIAGPSPRQLQASGRGIEPLTSALDAAVRLATDASVAAEALEKLKRLLEHKHQLDGLRSSQAALARPSRGGVAFAAEAHAAALPPPQLPPLPLPVPAAEASIGSTRLPHAERRPMLERRGLDVRGFMAGFALSWAFGVVLYFFMTAG